MKIKIWTFIFLLLFGLEIQALNSFSHSVYFDINQSILSAEEFKKFESYIQNVSKENKVIKIEVLGYCDDIEHESIVLNLSKKRSNYIKKKLKQVFDKQELKQINWCHKLDWQSMDTEQINSLLAKYRRIDIVFNIEEYKGSASATIQKGDKFILNGILFKGGEDILLEESMPTLKTLYNELIKNPNLIIQIQGHIYDADFTFKEMSTNEMTLSARRAKRIFDYLLFKGIDESRLSYIGFEGQFPLGKGPKYDRRVEVEIIAV
ncbi:MAG: OmpA family protein [Flavobacteriales bacterium]|nr:OmpA family protein [Flavobacteriales bacterium]MBL6872881.1 OmpA family protein [Flavobacteriales bacterium]